MGDCRATLIDGASQSIVQAPRSWIDCALNIAKISVRGIGAVQTPIHAMPGLAVPRESGPNSVMKSMVSTRDSMSLCRIENDDPEESAFDEFRAYNIAYCARAGKDPNSTKPVLPRRDGRAFRLSPCNTQPTRAIAGLNEQVLRNGQTFRYDVPLQERVGTMLVYGCDGMEDNGAIPAAMVASIATSKVFFMDQLYTDNIIFTVMAPIVRQGFPCDAPYTQKMAWLKEVAESGQINVADGHWLKSIARSAQALQDLFGDQEQVDRAFVGQSAGDLELLCKMLVEHANVRGSGDNVTCGVKKWF
jgi:hypothetical protein